MTSKWRSPHQNYLIVSILPYHILLFSPFLPEVFTYKLGNVTHILSWRRNARFWKVFPSKENSNSATVFLISNFLYWQRVTFYASFFYLLSMLITCSVINGSTVWKLYTHKQFEGNMESINFAYSVLQVVEIKVKHSLSESATLNRCWFT